MVSTKAKSTLASLAQPEKAFSPIFCTVAGSDTLSKLAKFLNQYAPPTTRSLPAYSMDLAIAAAASLNGLFSVGFGPLLAVMTIALSS